jgi:hypothetical protein
MKKSTTLILAVLFVTLWSYTFGQGPVTWTPPVNPLGPVIGTFPGGTVTVTQTGAIGSHDVLLNSGIFGVAGVPAVQTLFSDGGFLNGVQSNQLHFTFSTPVIIDELKIGDINGDGNVFWDIFTFSQGFTSTNFGTLTGAAPIIAGFVSEGTWLTTTAPVSVFTVDFPMHVNNIDHAYLYWYFSVTPVPCAAGITAPPLSSPTTTNICPANSVDLNALHTGTTPAGATLIWSTDNDESNGLDMTGNAEDGNADGVVDDPTTVEVVGTYYAYYYDAFIDCYSPVSAAALFTITNCCSAQAPVLSY